MESADLIFLLSNEQVASGLPNQDKGRERQNAQSMGLYSKASIPRCGTWVKTTKTREFLHPETEALTENPTPPLWKVELSWVIL